MPSYCLFETAIGTCGLAWNERGLVGVQLPEADAPSTERRLKARAGGGMPAEPPPAIADTVTALQRHFAGERSDFSAVPVDLSGVEPFHARIYAELRAIGWGATVTYGELAAKAGAPGEAQEVGVAMARNRMPIVVPCHRVLGTSQKKGEVNTGGFSAYGGVATKAKLLALEGVDIGPRQKSLF
jgi:methylated-DNA-[protein]-cysteine S-methyltransferase